MASWDVSRDVGAISNDAVAVVLGDVDRIEFDKLFWSISAEKSVTFVSDSTVVVVVVVAAVTVVVH